MPDAPLDEGARRKVLREASLTYHLRHPHIVPIVDGGPAGDRFYFVMELCEGDGRPDTGGPPQALPDLLSPPMRMEPPLQDLQ